MTKYIFLIYVEMGCEYRMEEIIQGKHFSITDPPEDKTEPTDSLMPKDDKKDKKTE